MPTLPSASTRIRNPERVAWGVLLIAFAVFCLTCVLSVVAVHGFFFLSTVPMLSSVHVARGAISLTETDLRESTVREQRDFLLGNVVRPNPQSQALIVFRDPYDENRIFATITLDEAISSAALQVATRPRFEWGNAGYLIELAGVQGEVEVFVSEGYDGNLVISLNTTQGSEVRLAGSGQYSIRAFDDLVRVINQRGEALIINTALPIEHAARSIPPGYQGITQTDAAEIVVVEDGYVDLLPNFRFEQTVGVNFPDIWRCGNDRGDTQVVNTPSGKYFTGLENGRKALFLVRGEGADSHLATYCEQGALADSSPNWLDVSGYDYLALKTTFFINFQSLNRCGIDGSECPLMLRLDYVDMNGTPRSLFYGFYTVNMPVPVEQGYPLTCSSCRQEHIFIREKTWYSHSTGNLFDILTNDQRPHYITRVRFYASGHQYDTRVSEVSLIGGHLGQISPVLNGG
jgi:hypothetical protein